MFYDKLNISPEKVRAFALDSVKNESTILNDLARLGIGFAPGTMDAMHNFYQAVMDEAPAPVTVPTAANALQFLQYFFANSIKVVTQARVADELMGRVIAGNWYDEQIVANIVERTGQPRPYGDTNNVPLSGFNQNFEARTIVRMELGLEANRLEMLRVAAMRLDSVALKRDAVAEALAISANDIAFNGFNNGAGHTYGILNDPGLPAYVSVSTGAASHDTEWSGKTFAEITADIRTAFQALRVRSGAHFNPERDACTLAVAVGSMEALAYTSEFGFSVADFIKKNYPGCRIVAVPQFNAANSGDNVFYLIADQIAEQKVVSQNIQSELFLLGTQPTAKGMIEDYSNGTAGVFVTVPIGVVRYTGI